MDIREDKFKTITHEEYNALLLDKLINSDIKDVIETFNNLSQLIAKYQYLHDEINEEKYLNKLYFLITFIEEYSYLLDYEIVEYNNYVIKELENKSRINDIMNRSENNYDTNKKS